MHPERLSIFGRERSRSRSLHPSRASPKRPRPRHPRLENSSARGRSTSPMQLPNDGRSAGLGDDPAAGVVHSTIPNQAVFEAMGID